MGILRTNTVSGIETPTPVTGSVVFDGNGDYLSTPDNSQFDFEAGNWTVEGWIYMNSLPSSGSRYTLAAKWVGTGNNYSWICNIFNDSGNMELSFSYTTNGSTATDLFSNGGPSEAGKWYHIAFVRDSSTLRQFVNGVQLSTNSISGTIYNGTADVNIGRHNEDTNYINGYISNLRILKGTALYTSNFTPPTRELQRIGDTVLLCCNNPDSAGAEATGKTITVNGNAVASTFSPGLVRDFTYGTQFDGVSKFDTQGYFVPPSGTTEQRSRGRGLFGSGYDGGAFRNTIDYVNIQSLGIAQDFGDLTVARESNDQGFSSLIRGFFAGGTTPTNINVIDYVTIASTSNAIDFGDLLSSTYGCAGVSNSTRGLMMGGNTPTVINVIQYITMSSIGNTQDFGDLTGNFFGSAGFQSPTRGVCAGGGTPAADNTIQYVTIATLGNAQDFGDATFSKSQLAGASNSTRGIFAGGTNENTINYVTIATTGNASDFGDLITGRREIGASSTPTRWVVGGGYNDASGVRLNSIEYVTIATTGNAQDFGDLSVGRSGTASCSDSHGGIS